MNREALVVCSDKSIGIGITIWDVDTGQRLLHIPTCASPPRGLICLRNHFLVASLIHRQGSVAGGSISIWPLNKPQAPLLNHPVEAIGPVCSTKDGVYLAGGTPSGNVYLWEVDSGRLLKTWRAHYISLTSMVFSNDGSLLISGSDDGMIHSWSMISLLDVADYGSLPFVFHSSSEHWSSVTTLLSTSGSSNSVFFSSSLDGTCKVWDLFTGGLLQTHIYPIAITAITLDPREQILLSGSADGRIFVSTLDIGLEENPCLVLEGQPIMPNGHNGPITALAFCRSGLLSASEDCTACLWDVVNWVILRRFHHQKGPITNLVVIPQSSLVSVPNHRRTSNQSRLSSLEKFPQPPDLSKGTLVSLNSCLSLKEDQSTTVGFQSEYSLNQQILELEQGCTPAALEMKVEKYAEGRLWAMRMSKHIMEMNKHLQCHLLDLMECRLLWPSPDSTKKRKVKVENRMVNSQIIPQEDEQPQSLG